MGNASSLADQNVVGDGSHHQKHHIRELIVIAGVGDPVWPVIIKLRKVDISIGFAQDIQGQLGESPLLQPIVGGVVLGGLLGRIPARGDLAADAMLAKGHLTVKVANAARALGIENVSRPSWRRVNPRQLAFELAEHDQRF